MDPISIGIAGSLISTAGGIMKAKGDSEAMGFKAAQAEETARLGRVAADETDTQLREQLRSTQANIRAIRASAIADPDSPTSDAILQEEARIGDRERRIKVGNLISQAESDERSASFYRSSAKSAFRYGVLGAIGGGLSDLSGRRKFGS